MDLAVAPYPGLDDFYFSPLKVYEYLAAGLPVVTSDVGTLPALLVPPDTAQLGVVYPAGSVHQLAAAVSRLRQDPTTSGTAVGGGPEGDGRAPRLEARAGPRPALREWAMSRRSFW